MPRGAWAIAALSGLSVSLYVLWLTGIWVRRQGGRAFAGLCDLGVRAFFCALPGAALCWWLSAYCLRTLALPPVWAACVTLALSGCVFALLFLPLSAIFAPSILENVWQRLHKKRAS